MNMDAIRDAWKRSARGGVQRGVKQPPNPPPPPVAQNRPKMPILRFATIEPGAAWPVPDGAEVVLVREIINANPAGPHSTQLVRVWWIAE